MLGNSTKDTPMTLNTMGLMRVFWQLGSGEENIIILRKKNDFFKGFMREVASPIDPNQHKFPLTTPLQKWPPPPLT